MKSLLFSLATLCCTPLFAQSPSATEPSMPTPPQHQQVAPMRTLMADGSVLLCDSTVTYDSQDLPRSKTEYTYDAEGRTLTRWNSYHYDEEVIIWEGEQSCDGWNVSLRFNDHEGRLPSLSDGTYDDMVGKTMYLDIKEVNGEGTWIRVTNGWWSSVYVPDTPVQAGETLEFLFTQEMADECKQRDLMFLSNNGLTITKFYWKDSYREPSPTSKIEYTFDTNGHTTSWADYSWQNGAWAGDYKWEYTYDANGNQTRYVSYLWQDGAWVVNSKKEYTYDANGNRTSSVSYDWQDGVWIVSSKGEYTIDANGHTTSSVSYDWQDGAWIVSYKYEATYDANGNCTSDAYYSWQNGAWAGDYKWEYTYDANGNQTSQAYYRWQDGAWIGSSKSEYTYDANGNQTNYTQYYWQDGAWVIDTKTKYEYTYDADGNQTSHTHYYWRDGAWVAYSKNEYTYDADGNQTSYTHYYWRDGAWVAYSKYEYTFDANGNQISNTYYNRENEAWVLKSYTLYYYSLHTPQSIAPIASDIETAPYKQFMPDGRIVIIRDGRSYDLGGQLVK